LITDMDIIKANLEYNKGISFTEFLEAEISAWKDSKARRDMIAGKLYYDGAHDILERKRTVIGSDGLPVEVYNLPNNKLLDNQYAKLVDQKVNYLMAKKPSFQTDNKSYSDAVNAMFGNRFLRLFRRTGEDSLNCGIAWLHVYYSAGELKFMRINPDEVLPFWRDNDHTGLDALCRVYAIEVYIGREKKIVEKVEYYDTKGVKKYTLDKGKLIPEGEESHVKVFTSDGTLSMNWEKVPFIAFKYNARELPLINRVKSLQDAINTITSDFMNNMQEDARNTLLILINYDGENLGEFRRNLSQYGAVKVKTVDGAAGDLKTLQVEVKADNYKAILEVLKKALIENGRGLDAKADKMGGNINQMNIQSMYTDIDLDANGMENEYQASFEELLWFVNIHLKNTGAGDFKNETLEVVFNRDILINESESIDNCAKSVGVISNETIVAQHPWVTDPEQELKKIEQEKQQAMEQYNEYQGAFGDGDGNAGADE